MKVSKIFNKKDLSIRSRKKNKLIKSIMDLCQFCDNIDYEKIKSLNYLKTIKIREHILWAASDT